MLLDARAGGGDLLDAVSPIEWGHPLNRAAVALCVWHPSLLAGRTNTGPEYVSRRPVTPSDSPTMRTSGAGRGTTAADDANQGDLITFGRAIDTSAAAGLAVSAVFHGVWHGVSSSTADISGVGLMSGSWYTRLNNGVPGASVAGTTLAGPASVGVNVPWSIGWTAVNGVGGWLYVNGVPVASGAYAANFAGSTCRTMSDGFNRMGALSLKRFAVYAHALTPADHATGHDQMLRGYPDLLRRVRPWSFGVSPAAPAGNRRRRVLLTGGG